MKSKVFFTFPYFGAHIIVLKNFPKKAMPSFISDISFFMASAVHVLKEGGVMLF